MLMNELEWVMDENGGHFKKTLVETDFELKTDREHFVCQMCGIKDYPDCMQDCDNWKRLK